MECPRKPFRWSLFVLFITIAATALAAAPRHPALAWEDLPLIRTGVKLQSLSSADPGCSAPDAGKWHSMDGDEKVLTVHKGFPGTVVQLWFTTMGPTSSIGNLNLYLNNSVTPSYSEPIENYFASSVYPHLTPLWDWDKPSGTSEQNAIWSFPCVPFDSVCKITASGGVAWYQTMVHRYREERFSEQMTRPQIQAFNNIVAAGAGTFPGTDSGEVAGSGTLSLSASGSGVLYRSSAPGVVRLIRIQAGGYSAAAFDRIYVRLTTDGFDAAYLPLTAFCGGYVQATRNAMQGLPCGYDGSRYYFYFPVPFWTSCSLQLENRNATPLALPYEVRSSSVNPYPKDYTGYFRIKYNDSTAAIPAGQPDFRHLSVKGSGLVVGMTGNLNRMYGGTEYGSIEENFSYFVDGSKTPALRSTGGEDYFCQAFGLLPHLQTPFSGGFTYAALADGWGCVGYKFNIVDYVPFLSSVEFTQDHNGVYCHDMPGWFKSSVFYYLNPVSFLTATDSLDVGTPASETAHNYSITGSRARMQTDQACYEGDYGTLFTDAGRWTDGTTRFTVKIDPANDGVRVRKRCSNLTYDQEILVLVDGDTAGIWFEQGSLYSGSSWYSNGEFIWIELVSGFRDTEYELPARLTAGKSSLTLTMITKGAQRAITPCYNYPNDEAGLTSEYYYWIFCYKDDPAAAIGPGPGGPAGGNPPSLKVISAATACPSVELYLPSAGAVRLQLVDLCGRELSLVYDGPVSAGTRRFPLAKNRLATGRPASGVHFVTFKTDGYKKTIPVVLLP